jgi:hypothetical protein
VARDMVPRCMIQASDPDQLAIVYDDEPLGLLPAWYTLPLQGTEMVRVNSFWLYELGAHVHALLHIRAGMPMSEAGITLLNTRLRLRTLDTGLVPLPACQPLAQRIISLIDRLVGAAPPEEQMGTVVLVQDKVIEELDARALVNAVREFEPVLRTTLEQSELFYAPPKRLYSTRKLIEGADAAFSDATKKRLSGITLEDIREAGKCLAFERATACGFHILRALEAVLVDYISTVTTTPPPQRNLGQYIITLRNNGAAAAVLAVIDQIRALHRNPLMHPEDVLTLDQAIGLFQVCQSAIEATIADMEQRGLFPPQP